MKNSRFNKAYIDEHDHIMVYKTEKKAYIQYCKRAFKEKLCGLQCPDCCISDDKLEIFLCDDITYDRLLTDD